MQIDNLRVTVGIRVIFFRATNKQKNKEIVVPISSNKDLTKEDIVNAIWSIENYEEISRRGFIPFEEIQNELRLEYNL